MSKLIHIMRLSASRNQVWGTCKENIRKISQTACVEGPQGRSRYHQRIAMKKRDGQLKLRQVQGEPKIYRRSTFVDWDQKAELFSFCKRLSEDIDENLLNITLRDASYVADEMQKIENAGLEDVKQIESNVELAAAGQVLIRDFCTKYMRWSFPLLPEEGIQAIVDFLSSDDVLGKAGSVMGFRELLLSRDYPPEIGTYATALRALTSAINHTSGLDRCQKFILDFIIAQTSGKDIWDMWKLDDPFHALEGILAFNNMEPPEPRIIDSLGPGTVEACYYVGIFSAKKVLGTSYGETLELAKETSSLESLNILFNTPLSRDTLIYGPISPEVALCNEPHDPIHGWKIPEDHLVRKRLKA